HEWDPYFIMVPSSMRGTQMIDVATPVDSLFIPGNIWMFTSPLNRWQRNNRDVDIKMSKEHHSMVGGNLEINNPEKSRDEGTYVCIAYNIHGTIRSREATLNFGCKQYLFIYLFSTGENINLVFCCLVCKPSPAEVLDDLSYRWVLNDFPEFITLDKRRYVSQTNGNLYIAKVEASDKGNYSCFVTSNSITKSVFSSFIPLIPQADRKYWLELSGKDIFI
uniref:Contactin 1 n=1 Tax=Varanus komodoensis TaxID=61221 RepID=A0A8D2J5U2_VARKO